MATVADVYRALNAMVTEGVVQEYAVCGGTAALFYAETLRTFDIDIFVVLEQKSFLVDISPIYNWARSRGYEVRDEYLLVHGVPVQVLDGSAGLELEAVKNARPMDYDSVPVPVVSPEYLVLFYAKARGRQRIARALDLLEFASPDEDFIKDIALRYGLQDVWRRLKQEQQDS
ncbi:hypothetical protein EON83_06740 [bacterium]|nr:MAG: hypothetical protein EON83_06740 [bacterium]